MTVTIRGLTHVYTGVSENVVALAGVTGAGLGLAGPLATTLMYDASPPERVAEVVGMRMTVANIGQTAIPLLSGAAGSAPVRAAGTTGAAGKRPKSSP